MANKGVTYKEPKDYFTPGMLKVAREWDKKQAAEKKTESKKSIKKK